MDAEELQAAREAIAASRKATADGMPALTWYTAESQLAYYAACQEDWAFIAHHSPATVAALLDGYERALAEVEQKGKLVDGYRRLLAVQDAEQAPMLAEIEAWKSATGLECGGDPDGVTPAHLEAALARLRAPPTDAEVEAAIEEAARMEGYVRDPPGCGAAIAAFQAGRAK